jgi:serine protease AprX
LLNAGSSGLETVPVIVKVDPAALNAVRKALRDLGLKTTREHALISAFTLDVPVGMLERIAAIPGVLGLSFDAEIGADLLGTVTTVPNTSGTLLRDTLGLNAVDVTGRGVTVALLDSGIAPMADFGYRIKAFYDFTRGGIATAPYDDHGHGTHVAGLIGGSGLSSFGVYRGVAPGVSFVGLKVLNAAGGGRTSDLIAAVEFATSHKAALGIDVINLSLGHPPYESAALDPLVQAVQHATQAGILVVSSAGNNGINKATRLRR